MKKETDLAKHVINYLKDNKWNVWQEVKLSKYICSIHDIIAVKHCITWCIECKLSFNLKVIEQSYRSNTIFKSIAVPRNNDFGQLICRNLGIGYMIVSDAENILEYSGKVFRHNYKHSKDIIQELSNIPKDYSKAGSKGNYWTPYKSTMQSIRVYIYENPGCSYNDILLNLKNSHFSSPTSARSCIRKDLELYEKSWCKIENNRYFVIK
jgi:hypothetical protein